MATVVRKVKLPAKNESECDKIVKNALKNYPYALNSFGEANFCGSGDIVCGDVSVGSANCGNGNGDCACADFCGSGG